MRRLSGCALLSVLLSAQCWQAEMVSFHLVHAAVASESAKDTTKAGCDRATMRIVVDVGHTPEAGGALSARGIHEYEFNLRLATQIRNDLMSAGFLASHLMTTKGAQRNLERRADRANKMQAELFISIHHDSVQDSYLRQWKHGGREHLYSDKFKGYSVFVSYANAHVDASRRFAVDLAQELKAHGLTFTTHHAEKIKGESRELIEPDLGVYRFDELVVLKRTNAPAVLLEAGVIVNRAEEVTVATADFRKRVSESVVAAALKLCGARP
jgi:N-acetylmuramoyl-L-alanine amidase